MNKIYYVSGNKFKLEMAQDFFDKFSKIKLKQAEIDFIEPQIDNQIEIALLKAKQAYKKYKSPLLVDDIGFYFNQYPLFPGTMTKHIANTLGYDGIKKLYNIGDTGYLRIVLIYMVNGKDYQVFDCKTECTLIKPDKIDSNDNLFIKIGVPLGYNDTIYNLKNSPDFYDTMPRNIALRKFLEYFQKNS